MPPKHADPQTVSTILAYTKQRKSPLPTVVEEKEEGGSVTIPAATYAKYCALVDAVAPLVTALGKDANQGISARSDTVKAIVAAYRRLAE